MRTAQELRQYFSEVDWSRTDFAEHQPHLVDWAVNLLGELPGRRILDLGCGSATLAVELAARGFVATGLDLWIEPAKRRCAARGVDLELLEQDMRELDRAEVFDAVINWDVSGIGMLGEAADRQVLRRVQRALTPGGKLLIQSYSVAYAEQHGMEGLTWDASARELRGEIRGHALAVRLYTPAEWLRMLEDCELYPVTLCPPQSDRSVNDEMMLTLVAEKRPTQVRSTRTAWARSSMLEIRRDRDHRSRLYEGRGQLLYFGL